VLEVGQKSGGYRNLGKLKKKDVWSNEFHSKCHNSIGHSLYSVQYRGNKICYLNMDFMGINRAKILRRFQKYKLSLIKIFNGEFFHHGSLHFEIKVKFYIF
jgi:hypothetical protein